MQLKTAPEHMAIATLAMKPAPRRAVHNASKNPHGRKQGRSPARRDHELPPSGLSHIRLIVDQSAHPRRRTQTATKCHRR